MKMSKANYIKILILFAVFSSTKSFSQIFVEKPELFRKDILNDSISKLYSIEYNSSDSNIVDIIKFYPSGQINSKWNYTSLSDSIINKFEIWYENGICKRIFTLNSIIDQKKRNKPLSKNKNPYCFYHINKYYNGELKTYWENGQIKRHDVFSDGNKTTGITWDQDSVIVNYYNYQIDPELPGSVSLSQFILNNLVYPELAKEYGVQGRVHVSFDIEKDGTVSNIRITKSAAKILDDEALRIIKLFPDWQPGNEDGENIMVSFTIPINFQLG